MQTVGKYYVTVAAGIFAVAAIGKSRGLELGERVRSSVEWWSSSRRSKLVLSRGDEHAIAGARRVRSSAPLFYPSVGVQIRPQVLFESHDEGVQHFTGPAQFRLEGNDAFGERGVLLVCVRDLALLYEIPEKPHRPSWWRRGGIAGPQQIHTRKSAVRFGGKSGRESRGQRRGDLAAEKSQIL
jgi:hypothetical protein